MSASPKIPAFLVLAAFAANADAGEKPMVKAKRLSAADCAKLVEQLVNRSKPPFKAPYVLELPKGCGETQLLKAFKEIGGAYDALSKNVEVALPVLMRHVRDRRYSFVQEQPGSGVFQKQTVGDACGEIISANVEAHAQATTGCDEEGRPRRLSFISHCGGLDRWWRSRKGKSLAELQLEAMDWVLKQKKPQHFTQQQWRAALAKVRTMAAPLRGAKKPVVVDHRHFFFSR